MTKDFIRLGIASLALLAAAFYFPAVRVETKVEPSSFLEAQNFLVVDLPVDRLSAAALKSFTKRTSPPALDDIKKCLSGELGKTGECLDGLFGLFFDGGGTTPGALAAVRKYEADDLNFRYSCHPILHAIGRETFRRNPTVHESFALCDQTCHSGCYHGAMERFLRGDPPTGGRSSGEAGHISEDEIKKKIVAACDPNQPLRFRFQCFHGLGHALVFFLNYKLESALGNCDLLGDQWSRSSCYGGAFMENVFSATPEKRDLDKRDYHYPCSKLDKKYKADCYVMQTTRMTEMGLSAEKLFEECKNARDYRLNCMQSIGRDLSNDVRTKDPRLTSAKCELVLGEDRNSCIRGVIFALIDNTWDGKYAFPFCASFGQPEDVKLCFMASGSYMRGIFSKSIEDIQKDCRTYLQSSSVCISSVSN